MAKITYIEHNGTEHVVDVPNGWSLMEGAVQNNIDGIDADCGGCMSCATCHVYIDESFVDKLTAAEDVEEDMLDCTACERADNSRLSCQITVTDDLDGLVVRMPEFQS
ncbi:MAG: 2Fe-2S iron-sulfur cluster-binding protein [Xanthomonadales bacterium]|nr:2Fe-2S iron-sulfur cluster-binding protein [Xanthomonadales bacterium]